MDIYDFLFNVSDSTASNSGSGQGGVTAPAMDAFIDEDMVSRTITFSV